MKKITTVVFMGLMLTVFTLSGCLFSFDNSNTSITIQDSDDRYELSAHYNKQKTKRIQHYIDANIAPQDRAIFQIRTNPGKLQIRFDKKENDEDAYLRIKRLGEGIKATLSAD